MNIPPLRPLVIALLKRLGLFRIVRTLYFRILQKPLPPHSSGPDLRLQSKILMEDVDIALENHNSSDPIIFLKKKL